MEEISWITRRCSNEGIMRIARLAFNRTFLYSNGGITTEMFKDMMDYLPQGSSIVGIGSAPHIPIDYLFVQNSVFLDTPDGSIPPDIEAKFNRRSDGTAYCSGVDWKNATGTTQTPFGVQVIIGNGKCLKAPWPKLLHDYEVYVGLRFSEELCKYCGDKKP